MRLLHYVRAFPSTQLRWRSVQLGNSTVNGSVADKPCRHTRTIITNPTHLTLLFRQFILFSIIYIKHIHCLQISSLEFCNFLLRQAKLIKSDNGVHLLWYTYSSHGKTNPYTSCFEAPMQCSTIIQLIIAVFPLLILFTCPKCRLSWWRRGAK